MDQKCTDNFGRVQVIKQEYEQVIPLKKSSCRWKSKDSI